MASKMQKKGYQTISKTFSRKSYAAHWAKERELEMERGVFESTSKAEQALVGDLLTRFWEEVACHYKSANSVKYKVKLLKKVLGHICLINLSVDLVRDYKEYRLESVSGDTVRKEMSLLKRMIDRAMKEWNIHLPKGNPLLRVTLPAKGKARDRRLKSDEYEMLRQGALEYGGYISHAFELAAETAMRRGELVSLLWSNVNLKKRTAFLPETKNGSSRTVPLSPKAIKIIEGIPRSDARLFPIRGDALGKAFQKVVQRQGIKDLRFHDLRHEATSRLFEKGLQLMEVSAITGHKDLAMLKRYTHLDAEKLALKLSQ